jgi:hypothetical protein
MEKEQYYGDGCNHDTVSMAIRLVYVCSRFYRFLVELYQEAEKIINVDGSIMMRIERIQVVHVFKKVCALLGGYADIFFIEMCNLVE